jgi:hypothetical protein
MNGGLVLFHSPYCGVVAAVEGEAEARCCGRQ